MLGQPAAGLVLKYGSHTAMLLNEQCINDKSHKKKATWKALIKAQEQTAQP